MNILIRVGQKLEGRITGCGVQPFLLENMPSDIIFVTCSDSSSKTTSTRWPIWNGKPVKTVWSGSAMTMWVR